MFDISSLRERISSSEMSVSELNSYIKCLFDSSRPLASVTVVGEISNLIMHSSGHVYFSLKDNSSQLKAVMFRGQASSLGFVPTNGMRVSAYGSVSVYTRDGSYRLYVSSMNKDGIGELYVAYECLKAKLLTEGLFDSETKKCIPEFPRRVGVITSPTGAAVRDIINILGRRYPLATVYLYPAIVQGDGAEPDLIKGLDYFDRSGLVDVVIIGRGGGSIEDLWAFNSEELARRIYSATVPIISAVGHETDTTICDLVADLRAPTPSAAAELAVPDIRELDMRICDITDRLDTAIQRRLERAADRMEALGARLAAASPRTVLAAQRTNISHLCSRAEGAVRASIGAERARAASLVGALGGLNPLATLSRGFAIAEVGGRRIDSIGQLSVGDEVTVRLHDGAAQAKITRIE